MAGIFKAYDIRGIVGQSLTEEIAYRIGRAYVTFLGCRKVVVGQDMRSHSDAMFQALARGIMEQGADVIRLGVCSTPMSYYANGALGVDGSIMITASHNTAEWNGFKLCRQQAIPISGLTGIKDLENLVANGNFAPPPAQPGTLTEYNILPDYIRHIASLADIRRPVRIVADYANAMGIMEAKALPDLIKITPLFDTLDGTFPHHEANPLKEETLVFLQEKVRAGTYDFGVAFDGDADRVGFVDEKGSVIPMDIITALIAQTILRHEPGHILYDLRSSWTVREVILVGGGTPHMCRVGHAFIKQQMRELNAAFAGELSGHYYFRDNFYTESSALAVLCLANLLSATDQPLSKLVQPLRRYDKSPEINSEVQNPPAVLARLKEIYADGKITELDGLSVEYADWWFNVRASNTEPLVRLNLEAKSAAVLKQRQAELLKIIRA